VGYHWWDPKSRLEVAQPYRSILEVFAFQHVLPSVDIFTYNMVGI
jgi:hypothetical protein